MHKLYKRLVWAIHESKRTGRTIEVRGNYGNVFVACNGRLLVKTESR